MRLMRLNAFKQHTQSEHHIARFARPVTYFLQPKAAAFGIPISKFGYSIRTSSLVL